MKVLAVSVGRPREAEWEGQTRTSGIWKTPVEGRVHLGRLNFDGDGQHDLRVHGGPSRAAYLYPAEHYDAWRRELPSLVLTPGAFGENLTVTGLREDEVRIGDQLAIGDAIVVVTQPRLPCTNLAMRLGQPDIIRRFTESGRFGFYLGVVREGSIGAGDSVAFSHREERSFNILEIATLYLDPQADPVLMRRAIEIEALSPLWRERFAARIGV